MTKVTQLECPGDPASWAAAGSAVGSQRGLAMQRGDWGPGRTRGASPLLSQGLSGWFWARSRDDRMEGVWTPVRAHGGLQATRWRGWGCKGDRLRALASCHLAARTPLGTQDVLRGPTNFQRALPPCSEASGPENSPEGEGATLAEDEPWLCSFNFKPQESKPKAAGSAPPAPQPSCPPPPPHPGQLAALRPRCSLGSPGCTGH